MQQPVELLVATLVYPEPGREADTQTYIRWLEDTVRSAPGIVTARFFRGQGESACYFILTTWADEESWLRAQERHNPKTLLQERADLFSTPAEQWLMSYQWGYNRPSIPSTLMAAHIMTLRTDAINQAQQASMAHMRQQVEYFSLIFAFVAREKSTEQTATQRIVRPHLDALKDRADGQLRSGVTLLTVVSWAGELEREAFYAASSYEAIEKRVTPPGRLRLIALDPL